MNATVARVWECWTQPEHITHWNNASDDWHTTHAENDLRAGGRFISRMEARDGSRGFDFSGKYTDVNPHHKIQYVLDDDRKVEILFSEKDGSTEISETFEAESSNPIEMQQQGWQNTLDNFKKYVEKGS